MLDSLISSGTKRAILKQLLSNVDEKYYVRQLAVILNMSVGTLHRELTKLEASGILTSQNVGNLRFFLVNKNNPLFKELKQIIFKTEGVQGRIAEELRKITGVKTAFIYGSFAKEKEKIGSDIDLFLVGEINEDELIPVISGLEKEFSREINYTLYTVTELKKQKNKKNSFVLEVIGGPKIFLIGAERDLR